jgi:ATP-dependent exoDNAse (exonuclease V) alpha subunit
MAIYHLSASIIKRSAGRSATAAAAYRAAEKIVDERTGEVHDYTRKRGVDYSVILAPSGAHDFVFDRSTLWNSVELTEKRKDAQLAREIDIAIPRELDKQQAIDCVLGFVNEQFCRAGMVADVCFHQLDSHNPHCHIMLTMRELEPNGFGKKRRDWNDVRKLEQWRAAWSRHANAALERAKSKSRIDHRSYAARGIERIPMRHVGPAAWNMGQRSERFRMMLAIKHWNDLVAKGNDALARVQRQIQQLQRLQRSEAVAAIRAFINMKKTPVQPPAAAGIDLDDDPMGDNSPRPGPGPKGPGMG